MNSTPFQIGDWHVYPAEGRIASTQQTLQLQPRVMQVLCRLATSRGELVSRSDLLADVWQGRAMSDEPLNRCIAELRSALDDNCHAPRYIETLPRRGYRLVVPVCVARNRSWRRRVIFSGLVLGIILAAVLGIVLGVPSKGTPRMLVLPLQTIVDDPELRLLGDGLTEELVSALAGLDLAVLSRSTTFAFQNATDSAKLRKAVDPDYLVEGSVRVVDGNMRITVQLVNARTDAQLMSEVFSHPLSIASATLDDVAAAVASRVDRSIVGDSRAGLPPNTPFPVYRKFIEARHLWRTAREDDLRRAIVLLEEVASELPIAVVHANLAAAYYALRNRIEDQGQFDARIESHLQTALMLEPDQPFAMALSAVLIDDSEPVRTFSLLEKALAREPSMAQARFWKMQSLYRAGYLDEADQLVRQMLERDPLSEELLGWLASLELALTDLDVFFELVNKSEAMGWKYSDTLLFYLAVQQQDRESARQHLKRRWSHSTRVTEKELEQIVDAIFDSSGRAEAIALVHDMLARERPITRFWAFVWLDLLGAHDDAIDLILRGMHPRDARILYSIWGPEHRALRQHPRFHELVEHFRLQELWAIHGDNGFCKGEGKAMRCR